VKVAYSPRALADLGEIAAYLRPLNPSAATRVRDAILATAQILSVFLGIGRQDAVEGVRRIGVRRLPYSLYYVIDRSADEGVVVTIRHDARDAAGPDG
jgi:plasmid stabilization system protein ParE